jgi:transcriptional regulator with XRE-family HTH domain
MSNGPVPATLGERIAECRANLGWTQKTLADRAGISVTFLSELENGHRMPGTEIALRLADALGVTIDYLLRGHLSPTGPARPVVVPPALAAAAEERGWSFGEAVDLLKAHQLVIARRSSTSAEEKPERLSKSDWMDMHQRWFNHETDSRS